jgi:2-polyprenyl-3-methyl-5-hydroxy-6-metoxy-1,4-benzoquinol methylase
MKGFRVAKEQYIIQQLGQNSNVLHVGCTHAPSTIERWNSGVILHKELCDQAKKIGSKVIGIDIDDSAIEFLRSKMPDETILNVDAHKLSEYFGEEQQFDLIIAGDVIEHLPNPGLFLQSCSNVLSPGGKILITTTNAFNVTRFIKAILFHESVHNEHTAYYSCKTIDRLLNMCNLEVADFGYYKCEPLNVEYSVNRFFSNLTENLVCLPFPQFSEGIVVSAYKK